MQPFRLSALELISAYRIAKPVAGRGDGLGDRAGRGVRTAYRGDLALRSGARAQRGARVGSALDEGASPIGPLDGVPVTVKDNIATRGDPTPLGTAASDMTPETDDAPPAARLREAGAILFAKTTMPDYGMLSSGLSSHHPLARNPWKLDRTPGGSSAGAGGRGRGALRAAAYRDRHRRLDPPAGRLVRDFWPQAQRRPRADRPALHRPGRRPADKGRRRRGPDDGDAVAARRPRLCEPQVRDARLGGEARGPRGPPHRSHAGGGLRRSPIARGQGGGRTGRARLRGGGRADRAARAVPDPGDAGRPRPFLAHARADRPQRARAREARRGAALHPRLGQFGERVLRPARVPRLQPDFRHGQGRDRGDPPVRLSC